MAKQRDLFSLERWHKSLKWECIRERTPLSLEDAKRLIQQYADHYNYVRLHSAIGYVTPNDMLMGRQAAIHVELIDVGSITTFIEKDADDALRRSRLESGDLLFSIAGTIGRAALVRASNVPANTNQAIAIIRGTHSLFLHQFLLLAFSRTGRR